MQCWKLRSWVSVAFFFPTSLTVLRNETKKCFEISRYEFVFLILHLSEPTLENGINKTPQPVTLWYTAVILQNGLACIFSIQPCSKAHLFHVAEEICVPCRAALPSLPSWWPTCCQCQVLTISLRWTCTPHRYRWAGQNRPTHRALLVVAF